METAAPMETVEKPKNGFPTVPTGAWKTLRKKCSEFSTVPKATAAISNNQTKKTRPTIFTADQLMDIRSKIKTGHFIC
jgi:hypothetical protein